MSSALPSDTSPDKTRASQGPLPKPPSTASPRENNHPGLSGFTSQETQEFQELWILEPDASTTSNRCGISEALGSRIQRCSPAPAIGHQLGEQEWTLQPFPITGMGVGMRIARTIDWTGGIYPHVLCQLHCIMLSVHIRKWRAEKVRCLRSWGIQFQAPVLCLMGLTSLTLP